MFWWATVRLGIAVTAVHPGSTVQALRFIAVTARIRPQEKISTNESAAMCLLEEKRLRRWLEDSR